MRGRHVFLDSLRLHGVDKIFGNPGTTETPMLDTLIDYPEIEYVISLQESIAVSGASFYAQASGKTAVANMHVAPGLGNAIGMMYGALKANSPVIVTAGAQDTRLRMRNPLLGHDLAAMAAPVVKWSTQVEHADDMAAVMQQAFRIANEHPKGPVFVALPIDVMEQETEIGAISAGQLAAAATPTSEQVSRLVELVQSAGSPVIVAGDDVARSGANAELITLAEMIGAPVFTELLPAQVSFPNNHDHFKGRLGADHNAIRRALGDHDLVLLLGGPFFEEVWYTGNSPFADDAKVVQLELSAATLATNFELSLGLSGDMQLILQHLNAALSETEASKARCAALAEAKAKNNADAEDRLQALWDRTPMTPARALHELVQALPEDAVLADESITAAGDVVKNFRLQKAGDGYAGRGGGIGQGLAGATGVATAHPDKLVVAVSGDGSAMYSIQALWTAAHHNMNLLFVILSNREYRVLKHNVDQYRRRFDAASNNPYPQMDLNNPVMNFTEMAAGMGVPGVTLDSPDKLQETVKTMVKEGGPHLLELIVEGYEFR